MSLSLKSFFLAFSFAAFSFAQSGVVPNPVPERVEPRQEIQVEEKAPAWSQFPRYLLEDQKAIWTAPFRIDSPENAKRWAVFGGVATGLLATDRWTSTRLPNTNGQVKAAMWTSRIGAVYTLLPATAGIWAVGALTKNEKVKKTGYVGVEALTNAALVSMGLKAITQRQRPIEGDGYGHFFKGAGRVWNSGSSFPSSHSMETWAVASAIAHQHPDSKIIPIVAYGLAGTVSASRIAARKHFASDVVVGAIMGYFIGEYVSNRHNPAKKPSLLRKVLSQVHFGTHEF